jgi:mRNA-degrading endonuclease RelE of RelBE toxin-antitoxin system
VTLTVVIRVTAIRNLPRIRSEDKDLLVRTCRAVASLADQPYPEHAVAWGAATGIYRLHAGDILIQYEVDDGASTVYIINIGSSPESKVAM